MAAVNCIPVTSQEGREQDAYIKLATEFSNIPMVKQLGQHSIGMWKALVYSSTKGELRENAIPNAQQLKALRRKMDRGIKELGKSRGGLAKALYLPEELYKDIPFVKNWYQSVADSAEKYKGHTSYFNGEMAEVFRHLKDASFREGSNREIAMYIKSARPKAQKMLQGLYKDYSKLKRKGKFLEANELYENQIVKFLKGGEGAVFKQFHDLASASNSKFADMVTGRKYSDSVVSAAKVWRNKIQPKAQELMIQGLNNYRNNLKSSAHLLSDFTKYDSTINTLESIINRYKSGELQKDGYFPVLSLDVMPSLSEAQQFLTHSRSETEFNKGADIISKLEGVLDNNIYVNKHLKDLEATSERISYNVIPIMDSYVRSASRFNFVSYNTGKYMQVMKNLHDTMNNQGESSLNAKLTALEGYISDAHGLVTGSKSRGNETAQSFTRAITAWQFVSKLGLNIRGVTRNATQSLLNWVYFGTKGISDVRSMAKNADMKTRMDKGLSNNGILFPEIREVYFEDFAPKVEYSESEGTYREKLDLTMADGIAKNIAFIAEKMGKPMQWVENSINRRFTFQLGYGLHWKTDDARIGGLYRRYDRTLKRKGMDVQKLKDTKDTIFSKNDSNEYEVGFENFRRQRSEKAGNSAVRDLHFDYSMTAKPGVLQTKTGSILGQFQHYGVNFFNLQRKIVRDGIDDIATSEWGGDNAWRMYRLGLLYTAVYGIFSPMMNADLGNLVQNDTFERLKSYHDAVQNDDEDAKKRAFFGKGPALGTLGGPFIGDVVTIGNLSGLYEMDEDSWGAYLAGYQDMADKSGNEKTKELVRVLNTQAARTIYSTYPKWRSGSQLGTLLQGELGLHPSKEIKERREALGFPIEKKSKQRKAPMTSNEAILRSLELLQS
jgi:hypothetical protein